MFSEAPKNEIYPLVPHAQEESGNPYFSSFHFSSTPVQSAENLGQVRATSTQQRTTARLVYCRTVRRERGSDEISGVSATSGAGIGFQLCQVNCLFVPEVL